MHDMYRSPVGKNLRQGDILDFVDVLKPALVREYAKADVVLPLRYEILMSLVIQTR
jgi:hypothetical protein